MTDLSPVELELIDLAGVAESEQGFYRAVRELEWRRGVEAMSMAREVWYE